MGMEFSGIFLTMLQNRKPEMPLLNNVDEIFLGGFEPGSNEWDASNLATQLSIIVDFMFMFAPQFPI